MKTFLLTLFLIFVSISLSFSQVFDSLSVVSPDYDIEDICWKGDRLFAACGEGGVFYSDDEGFTWVASSQLPDAGFGQEAANSIFAASNGDLIIGGNLNYNGSPFSGVVFRSSDDGNTWSFKAYEGLGGYEKSEKIVELPGGDLMMHGGQAKLFTSSLSTDVWTQITAPGGIIFGFEAIENQVFVVTNPAAGTAGTWVTSDLGINWERYGGNGTPVSGGTVTVAPIISTTDYKYVCIGGSYDQKGVFRSGISDTLWVEKNNGIDNFGIYPICMATDNYTIWMVFQDAGGGCYFTSSLNYADDWEEPVMGMPSQTVGGPCLRKLMVFKTHLYTYANNSIYRIANVAIATSVNTLEANNVNLKVYPNPAQDYVTVNFNNIDNSITEHSLMITDISGRIVYNARIQNESRSNKLNVSGLEAGYYIITLISGSKNSQQKLIINR